MSDRTARLVVSTLAVLWVVLFVGSFVAAKLTAPTGDGFTRGLNRVEVWFGWQFAGFVVALVCALVARSAQERLPRTLRRLGYAPLVADLVLLGLLILLVVGMRFSG